jgi:heterodisulfide reductase subunit C
MEAKVCLTPHSEPVQIMKDPLGNSFELCYQCGLCTASCRTAYAMKYTPRQVMNLLQLGCADEAVASGSGLLCTACYSCTFRCPRGVAVTDMMAAIQRLNLARNLAHRDIRRFYRSFMRTVERHGRFHEVEFLARYFLPNPFLLKAEFGVGFHLLTKGKICLRPARVKDPKAMAAMFRKAQEIEGTP